ncbi:MAG: phenylalanine--tRNA ligase subunit alpha [Bdellovibrionota bacterium]
MEAELSKIESEARAAIESAGSEEALAAADNQFLGRKSGKLSAVLKGLRDLPADERSRVGQKANEIKAALEALIAERRQKLSGAALAGRLEKERLDLTLPAASHFRGSLHPLVQADRKMRAIFTRMGFSIASGPECEFEYYNFEALNIPHDHPARDMQDTFYLAPGVLLRTHTSPVQIRTMEKRKPPVRIIAPGKVYRRDSDQTHSPMFHQIEGLWVDEGVTFADLKGVLGHFFRELFGSEARLRFRPSFFPFTEPSAEADLSCVFCGGKDSRCGVCKGSGWLEVMGCGMVDPRVFAFVDYDPEKYTGFAFGFGVERIAMLLYGVPDLRLFTDNDVRFLEQY